MKRLIDQFCECLIINSLAGLHITVKARKVIWLKAGNLLAHRLEIGGGLKYRSIIKANLVKRIDAAQLHVVGQGLTAQLPQFFKDKGCGDDGWARIESETVLAVHIAPPTRAIELLIDADAIAFSP